MLIPVIRGEKQYNQLNQLIIFINKIKRDYTDNLAECVHASAYLSYHEEILRNLLIKKTRGDTRDPWRLNNQQDYTD